MENRDVLRIENIEIIERISGEQFDIDVIRDGIRKIEEFLLSKEIYDVKVETVDGPEITEDGRISAGVEVVGIMLSEDAEMVLDNLMHTVTMAEECVKEIKRSRSES